LLFSDQFGKYDTLFWLYEAKGQVILEESAPTSRAEGLKKTLV
jgi:hypothetical protein